MGGEKGFAGGSDCGAKERSRDALGCASCMLPAAGYVSPPSQDGCPRPAPGSSPGQATQVFLCKIWKPSIGHAFASTRAQEGHWDNWYKYIDYIDEKL